MEKAIKIRQYLRMKHLINARKRKQARLTGKKRRK